MTIDGGKRGTRRSERGLCDEPASRRFVSLRRSADFTTVLQRYGVRPKILAARTGRFIDLYPPRDRSPHLISRGLSSARCVLSSGKPEIPRIESIDKMSKWVATFKKAPRSARQKADREDLLPMITRISLIPLLGANVRACDVAGSAPAHHARSIKSHPFAACVASPNRFRGAGDGIVSP
jgi:hypothetical protein